MVGEIRPGAGPYRAGFAFGEGFQKYRAAELVGVGWPSNQQAHRVRLAAGVPGTGPWFSFRFKGLEAACEEAARLVVGLRGKVDAVLGEVPCSECGGSRLADVASAVTLWGRPLEVWCRMPLGRLRDELERVDLAEADRKIAAEEDWVRYGVSARRKRNQKRLRDLGTLRQNRVENRRVVGSVKLTLPEEEEVTSKLVIEARKVTSFLEANGVRSEPAQGGGQTRSTADIAAAARASIYPVVCTVQ